jgi:hypothetical protein
MLNAYHDTGVFAAPHTDWSLAVSAENCPNPSPLEPSEIAGHLISSGQTSAPLLPQEVTLFPFPPPVGIPPPPPPAPLGSVLFLNDMAVPVPPSHSVHSPPGDYESDVPQLNTYVGAVAHDDAVSEDYDQLLVWNTDESSLVNCDSVVPDLPSSSSLGGDYPVDVPACSEVSIGRSDEEMFSYDVDMTCDTALPWYRSSSLFSL